MRCLKCGQEFDGVVCPNCQKKRKTKNRLIITGVVLFVVAAIIYSIVSFNNDLKKAEGYINDGNYKSAMAVLDDQLGTNGDQDRLYSLYADAYLGQEDYLSAVDILEKGIDRCDNKADLETKLNQIKTDYQAEIEQQEKQKAEADRLEAERLAKEEEERQKQEQEAQKESREDYIASCKEIAYSDLARNPDSYKGQSFAFTGEVIQVIEPTFGNTVTLRINVTKTEYGFYTDTIVATVSLPKEADRILSGDIITFYGDCEGLYSYQSILNQKISLPKIRIQYYNVH